MASKRVAVRAERRKAVPAPPEPKKKKPSPPTESKCGCKGHCGTRRCGCVKKGAACGDSCKCTGCKNPFNILKEYGIDCAAAARDKCLMDNIFKIEDLRGHLEKRLELDCCEVEVQMKDMIPWIAKCPAPGCLTSFRYSWCRDIFFSLSCRGMKHCKKCRECVDEGDRHCDDCNTCYFSGWSCFQCPCKGPDETGRYPDHIGPLHPVEGMMIAREMMAELLGKDSDWSEDDSDHIGPLHPVEDMMPARDMLDLLGDWSSDSNDSDS